MKEVFWTPSAEALLRDLWAKGQSAAQIAAKLNCSRSAVCAKLARLALKRGHAPPTAKPIIVKVPQQPLKAEMTKPPDPPRARQWGGAYRPITPPVQLTKRQLYEMLAQAERNTG